MFRIKPFIMFQIYLKYIKKFLIYSGEGHLNIFKIYLKFYNQCCLPCTACPTLPTCLSYYTALLCPIYSPPCCQAAHCLTYCMHCTSALHCTALLPCLLLCKLRYPALPGSYATLLASSILVLTCQLSGVMLFQLL